MRAGILLAPVLVGALTGCGALGESGPPPLVNAVAESTVGNGRFIAIVGPQRQHSPPFLGVPQTNIDLLRSWIDRRTGEEANQLYVEISYGGAERTYNAAHDAAGETLRFIPISKNEIACDGGCSYAEEFAAALPTPLLRAHRTGLTVTFTAKSGPPLAIAVSPELIEKQLAAIDAAHATLPTAASAAKPTP